MSRAQATEVYRQNQVLTASPEKTVRLLYERAIRNLETCLGSISDPAARRSSEVGLALGQAMSIISELRASLDRERGGDIAAKLDVLYEFCLDRISQANVSRTPEPVAACLRVMRELQEGWDAVLPG